MKMSRGAQALMQTIDHINRSKKERRSASLRKKSTRNPSENPRLKD